MTFNSYVFLLFFLPITLIGYFGLNKIRLYTPAKLYLLVMSWWFYAYFNYSYFFLILLSILLNYGAGRLLLRLPKGKLCKAVFLLSLLLNLGILFYYKYYDFFISNVNRIFHTDFVLLNVLLPLGISFFTFQQLSYVIDCYRKDVPCYSLLDYALFVSFFPQLVAGPIVLHHEIIPQFADSKNKSIQVENFSKGIFAFVLGLSKKVLLADTLGNAANWGFQNITSLDTTNAILVMLCYTFQIYFDFSGYSDMAVGIGKMFNIQIVQNFNSPYKALTISDFWKRWHITLTRFFTTYLYIPLGGNRKGDVRTYCNMFCIFFVSGVWHGASWNFIVWGVLHGLAVVFNRVFQKQIAQLHPALSWLSTFGFINLSWIFFRAPTLHDALLFLKQLCTLRFGPISSAMSRTVLLPEGEFIANIFRINGSYFCNVLLISILFFCLILCLGAENTYKKTQSFKPTRATAVVCSLLLVWNIVSFSGVSTFLYFNF